MPYKLKLFFTKSLFFLLFITLAGATFGQSWDEIIKLTASDGDANDWYGNSVSISENRALVGAWNDDYAGVGTGSVYYLEFIADTWIEISKITASDAEEFDGFGRSVSILGNKAIIGANLSDDDGLQSGSAYIFELTSGVWTETAKLTASDANAGDLFGLSVSISENKVIVGAYKNNDHGYSSGSAYIFEFVLGEWTETVKLTASDADVNYKFGYSVSIAGNYAIVGAYGAYDGEVFIGSAYIFEFIDDAWTETDKLEASDAAPYDKFGFSVSIYQEKVIVGAHGSYYTGGAYIFEHISGTWTETAILTASDADTSDLFGHSVSITEDKVIVGAFYNDDAGSNSGSAYIFEYISSIWTETAKITASDADEEDHFGRSVSISGNRAIVGAQNNDDDGSNSGSSYIFEIDCPTTSSSFTVSECGSYTVPSGDETYTSSITVRDTIPNICGQDSIMTISILLSEPNTGDTTATVCNSFEWYGTTYTESGTPTHILTNSTGCDSVLTLALIIEDLVLSTTTSGIDITASETGAEYQWLDCDIDYAEIDGETEQVFTPTTNGNYAVEITEGVCTDTSACVIINSVGIVDFEEKLGFSVSPNPTTGVFKLHFNDVQKDIEITLYSISGKWIQSYKLENENEILIEIEEENGVYLLEVLDAENNLFTIKIIKE